jgi:hypothetical protein
VAGGAQSSLRLGYGVFFYVETCSSFAVCPIALKKTCTQPFRVTHFWFAGPSSDTTIAVRYAGPNEPARYQRLLSATSSRSVASVATLIPMVTLPNNSRIRDIIYERGLAVADPLRPLFKDHVLSQAQSL